VVTLELRTAQQLQ